MEIRASYYTLHKIVFANSTVQLLITVEAYPVATEVGVIAIPPDTSVDASRDSLASTANKVCQWQQLR